MPIRHDKEKNIWYFETEELKGILQPWGHHHGIRHLIHKPTNTEVTHPDFTLLNLYFLFATGTCLASGRSVPKTVSGDEHAVRIRWEPTHLHKAELTACYQVKEPNLIDLTLTVRAREVYPAYEALLSSYFDLSFRPYIYVSGSTYADPPDEPHWYTPMLHHLYKDNALVFPRDPQMARLHLDGRWGNVQSIYRWKSHQYYALPLAIQANQDQKIATVLMSRPEDCAAVCWTVGIADIKVSSYQSDHMDDPFNARNPLYMSLFGTDFQPGNRRTVRTRLAVTPLDEQMTTPLAAYKSFISEQEK